MFLSALSGAYIPSLVSRLLCCFFRWCFQDYGFLQLVLVWCGRVCFFEVFSATVKRLEDTWSAIGFSPVKRSDLRCVVLRPAVCRRVDLFLFCGLVVKLSCVGGLSLLEAHSRFTWLSSRKPPVVLMVMVTISSVLSFELSVLWDLSFKFYTLVWLFMCPVCGFKGPFLWDLVSLLMGVSF